MATTWNPAQPTTAADNHPTYDQQPADTATACVCWDAGREGRDPWQGMPHPAEYGAGQRAAFEADNDI
jgi:hypothetical protein